MKNKILSIILVLSMLTAMISMMPFAASADSAVWDGSVANAFAGGDGSSGNPYQIANGAQLAYMAKQVNSGANSGSYRTAYYKLTADIVLNEGDAANWATTAPANVFTPIGIADNGTDDTSWRAGLFAGSFDGNGKTISGVYVNNTSSSMNAGTGLFAIIGNSATVKNFNITNSYISANKAVGVIGLIRNASNLTVSGIYSDVIVNAAEASSGGGAGGIVGQLSGSAGATVSGCVFAGTAKATKEIAGGILANGNGVAITINNCLNLGTVTAGSYSGGIVGRNDNASCTVKNCVSVGTATYTFAGSSKTDKKPVVSNSFYTGNLNNKNTTVNTSTQLNSITDIWNEVDSSITSVLTAWSVRENDVIVPTAVVTFAPHSEYYVEPVNAPDWLKNYETQTEFEITTAQQLCDLSDWVNIGNTFEGKTVKLGADIDMKGIDFTPIGKNENLLFKGTFDGNGKTVSNLSVTADEAGFFGYIANATVKSFAIVNATIKGSIGEFRVGGAVAQVHGSSTSATIENIYVNAALSGKRHVGGIVGQLGGASQNNVITNCVFNGTINATGNYIAGIVGNCNGAPVTVSNCLNAGTINGSNYVAGIATAEKNLTITDCVNAGTITAVNSYYGDIYAGNPKDETVSISDCYYVNLLMKNNSAGEGTVTAENNTKGALTDLIGNNATAPEGWTKRAGDIAVPAGCTVAPASLIGLNMVSGAAVRMANPTGLRFTAVIGADYLNALVGDATDYSYGIIIAPTDYIAEANGVFTVEALKALSYEVAYKEIKAEKLQNDPTADGCYVFTGTLVNVQEANYNRDFSAIAYVKVGDTYYYSSYSEELNSRNIAEVASNACADTSAEQNEVYQYAITEAETTVYSPYTEEQRKVLADFFQ